MTDRPRPYHRAEAERLLDYADEWAAQAGEPMPEAGELSCLAYAAVHALLAIHDALTAADRYAANEAKQRDGLEDAWQPRDWESVRRLQDEADNTLELLLCPECGDHINTHDMMGCRLRLCDCPRTPEDVARPLIDLAVKATREADTDG